MLDIRSRAWLTLVTNGFVAWVVFMYLVMCWRSRRQGDVEKGVSHLFAFDYHPCISHHIQDIPLGCTEYIYVRCIW